MDDKAADIVVDASGNVYVTGFTTTTTQGKNYATVKYNSSGTLQWTKYHNGAGNGIDEATAINLDASNNVYVTGTSHTGGSQDYYTIKYKPDNTVVWEQAYNGLFNGLDKAYDIAVNPSTNEIAVSGQTQTSTGYSYTTVSIGQATTVTKPNEVFNSAFTFTENLGQLLKSNNTSASNIKYYNFSTSPSTYFSDTAVSYVLTKRDNIANDTLNRVDRTYVTSKNQGHFGLNKRSDYYNFYLAHLPEGRAHVTNYNRLITPELYNKIDVLYTGNHNGLVSTFVCKPTSTPAASIKMKFSGADSIRVVNNDLIIYTKLGQIKHPRATAYELDNNGTSYVLGWFPTYVRSGNEITFTLGSYNTARNLIIDMGMGTFSESGGGSDNLEWCTYYGGQNDDSFYDISVIQEDYGTAHVAGLTMSTNFPLQIGQTVVQSDFAGGVDFVIVKFNADASRGFATYLGGSDEEYSPSIETDLNGNIYLAGMTKSTDFPDAPLPPSGAYIDDTFAGTLDLIVAKINSTGTELTWRTFYGGDSGETYGAPTAIALDNGGNIYVTTNSDANQQLVSYGTYNENVGGSVILKFNSALERIWVTLFGDAAATKIGDNITVDSQGALIITGQTEGGLFTVNPGNGAYYDASYNSTTTAGDIFIAKFNSSNDLMWSTYYGGINSDYCNAITTDDYDNIYLGCNTGSHNIPTDPPPGSGYYDDDSNGLPDIFLMKFDSDCKREWATFYGDGNNNNDQVTGVTITPSGQLFYCGNTNSSSNFELMSYNTYYYQNTMASNIETFYIKFNERLEHQWTTYFGGSQIQQLADIDHYLDEKLYGVGYTTSSQLQTPKFPIRQYEGGYWQPIMGDIVGTSFDGFIARFDIFDITTGEEEITIDPQDELSLFPNPANTQINLFFNAETQSEGILKVSDVTGKLIYMAPINVIKGENKLQTDITNLSEGLYFIELISDDKNIIRKFIKK